MGHVVYNVPRFGCELVMKTLEEKKQARILDVASGTGLGGKLVSNVFSCVTVCGCSHARLMYYNLHVKFFRGRIILGLFFTSICAL